MPTLFGEPQLEELLAESEDDFVSRIAQCITQAVTEGRRFRTSDGMEHIFNAHTRGKAGEKHVRAAVKQLHRAGIIGGPAPVNVRLEDYLITPGPAAPRA